MKSAEQIRKLMKSRKAIDNICKILEPHIIREAQKGGTSAVIPIDCTVCPRERANLIIEELERNGYTASATYKSDVREGQYINFNISWK